jgi:serine O-acetyltransferase
MSDLASVLSPPPSKHPRTLRGLRSFWRADLYRYDGRVDRLSYLKHILLTPGYRYTSILRLCQYLGARKRNPLALSASLLARGILRHYQTAYGIMIPASTEIGPGLHIGHPGTIVVHPRSRIGRNCNISQGVTLGQANRGPRRGYPTVGDGVYIGPGAKLVGAVSVGRNVAVGANCVVTKDVPDDAVIVGVPGRVISFDGAVDYVNHVDYPES